MIYANEKVSSAHGNLLAHLFAQLEAKWRGEFFNVDIKSAQLCLLKRILKDQIYGIHKGNLVIWTAALKEVRMLSVGARELTLKWILKRCKTDESDWPVIFHNLLLMCSDNRGIVFEVLYECLEESPNAPLMEHLIFLIGQNGSLGNSWIKWTLTRGCFKIAPIIFAGLLALSEDVEYFHVLGPALLNHVKLMQGVWIELLKAQWATILIDPVEYLKQVAKWIGSDCEPGIKGALQLIKNMRNFSDLNELSELFFIELYKLYPFARRELLKSLTQLKCNTSGCFWKQLCEIDGITLKENCVSDIQVLVKIIKEAPELLKNLIDHEDQIHDTISDAEIIIALIEIESILVPKALKSIHFPFSFSGNAVIAEIADWKELTVGELSVLKFSDGMLIPKFVELCELLQVPGALDGCKGGKGNLTDLAVEFVSSEAGEGIYNARERITMISKLVSSLTDDEKDTIRTHSSVCTSGKCRFTGVLGIACDWNSYEGTLKYLLERISESSLEFNSLLPKIPVKVDFQILLARAICKMSETEAIPLTTELLGVIGGMAVRVVSEPQLAKPLMSLLGIKTYSRPKDVKINVQKFSEISEPNLIKTFVEFAMEYDGIIEEISEELIKSIIMFYGMIDDDSGDKSANRMMSAATTNSKLKHVHLNEKSVNAAVMALLAQVQGKLNTAHMLLKHCPEIYSAKPEEFIEKWVVKEELIGLTRGLISGRPASKLHMVLTSFYDLITRLLQHTRSSKAHIVTTLKELTETVGGQLSRQVYSLIPLQQEKMQSNLKQEMNLKKSTTNHATRANAGKTVTSLVFAMEKFEETLIKVVNESGNSGWCEKIARSTARDFKIRLEQL